MSLKTESFESNGIKGAVRSQNRHMPIARAIYSNWLLEAYPEIREAKLTALPPSPPPALPPQASPDAVLRHEQAMERFNFDMERYALTVTQATAENPLAHARFNSTQGFLNLIVRLCRIEGAPFKIGADGRLDKPELLKAYTHFDDPTGENDEFWEKVWDAIIKVDAPLAPLEEQPLATLTEEQRNDPKSSSVASASKPDSESGSKKRPAAA